PASDRRCKLRNRWFADALLEETRFEPWVRPESASGRLAASTLAVTLHRETGYVRCGHRLIDSAQFSSAISCLPRRKKVATPIFVRKESRPLRGHWPSVSPTRPNGRFGKRTFAPDICLTRPVARWRPNSHPATPKQAVLIHRQSGE